MSLLPDNDQSSLASVLADSEAPQTSGAFSPNFEQPTVDTVIYDIISVQQADLLVADYRDTFAAKFPYVIIPEGVTSLALRQTSPMLFLAILVTTSWKLRGQQDHLDQTFLKALGTKLILEADRDMDLLRGLMSLAAAKEIPSDLDLVFHLKVAREAEKAYTFFNYTDIQQTQFMGEQQIQVYLNAFSVKVQDWRFRFPSSLTQDREYL
ncbi:hypothetical protein FOTG_10201 [Fusarium oxysporum f. sp. vasinfectum 25433]|uniref:Uncharacterized protein n=1 Tax=Fusarium oxysporum f. sp. vasinfectum 25433 TaxID=1089449 RepID=X0LLL4_FUSOX|nr:hypothetical protein FOTG_10201 [Fusarium oxysporum f. sp. vasinfectum 25433]